MKCSSWELANKKQKKKNERLDVVVDSSARTGWKIKGRRSVTLHTTCPSAAKKLKSNEIRTTEEDDDVCI